MTDDRSPSGSVSGAPAANSMNSRTAARVLRCTPASQSKSTDTAQSHSPAFGTCPPITVFYRFDSLPELEWMHSVLLGDTTASRHGAQSINSPIEDPPAAEDWATWEHPDRVASLLADDQNRERLDEI